MDHPFRKQLTVQLAVAGGIIAALVIGIGFVGSDLSERAAGIRSEKDRMEFERNALQSLITLKEQEKRAEGYATYLNGLLPRKDNLFGFRNQVTSLGKEEKMTLGFKFGNENHATALLPPSINFQITANGSSAGFRKLIDRLESSGYFIRLEAFDVNWAAKSGGETFNGSLTGRVFYRG